MEISFLELLRPAPSRCDHLLLACCMVLVVE